MSSAIRLTKCSFCRYIVYYACRKQLHYVRPNRKLLTFPYVNNIQQLSSIRHVSTTSVLFRKKRQDEEYESSSSSSDSDSDRGDDEFHGPRTQARKGRAAGRGQKQSESETGPKQKQTLFVTPEGKPLSRDQLDEEIVKAAESVAEELKGDPGQTKIDLLSRIKYQAHMTIEQKLGKSPQHAVPSEEKNAVEDLLAGMAVDSDVKEVEKETKASHTDKEEKPKLLREDMPTLHKDTVSEKKQEDTQAAKKMKKKKAAKERKLAKKSDNQTDILGDLLGMSTQADHGEQMERMKNEEEKETQTPYIAKEETSKDETQVIHKDQEEGEKKQTPAAKKTKKAAKEKKMARKSDVQTDILGDLLGMSVQADHVEKEGRGMKKEGETRTPYPIEGMDDLMNLDSQEEMFAPKWPGVRKRDPEATRERKLERQQQRERESYTSDWFIMTGKYNGQGLGIFTPEDLETAKEPAGANKLFDILDDKEQQERYDFPAANAFEEQICWTEEGKLWKFPIDNEQGWEEEANVSFEEHIFLEDLLEDFPKKGPVRHFMELVTTALSKNPYLTVAQKHEHIDWYRNYFEEKKTVIEESLVHADELKVLEQANN